MQALEEVALLPEPGHDGLHLGLPTLARRPPDRRHHAPVQHHATSRYVTSRHVVSRHVSVLGYVVPRHVSVLGYEIAIT